MKYLKMAVLAVALLALAAGSAQAQDCVAGADSANVRAEGETERVGVITVRCRGPRTPGAGDDLALGSSVPTKLEIAVTLNTDITNARNSSDMVASTTDAEANAAGYNAYSDGNVRLAGFQLNDAQVVQTTTILDDGADNGGLSLTGDVSDDLKTITWKHTDTDPADDAANFDVGTFLLAQAGAGFELKITGLRADASGVGHGGEITATVKVNGTTARNGAAIKVASASNGLDPVVKAATAGTECADFSGSARVTIREGNKNSFMQDDSFLITFHNIPEGVSVMVPTGVAVEDDQAATNTDEEDGSFSVNLVEGRAGDGVGKVENNRAPVELSASGTGEVRYTIGTATRAATQADVDAAGAETPPRTIAVGDDVPIDSVSTSFSGQEWAHVPVYFSWKGGEVVMNADAMVSVSFHPSGGTSIPRFVGDSNPDALLTIKDCVQELTFPFVSSASGYDTGIVVSNTSDAAGSCTASYSGSEDTQSSPMVEGNSHWIFLVSTHMSDYSGRLTVVCDFGGIDGYAQINDHMGNANGYLPRTH